ncbi:zinc-binding dehydrogenase [Terrilactibacillus tamarindi]|uniref:zinc-binding dehydrogenase n=1 Tax=Terrilactibacillus tamarindi TaxID=2599694 RepID=UPI0018AD0F0B|nr:zinc-binding dehydrogenase [Terrilactibacillus tamarindi]
MKALVKRNPGYDEMSLQEIPEPVVEGNQIKIKVAYTGICGSDIHSFKGEYNNLRPPVVLGHEFSGIVVDIGPNVKGIKIGDRVTSETTFQTCNTCPYCAEKNYNLCVDRKGIGTQVNGSFAEYVISREESVHVLPEHVGLLEAALTEPLACCVHAALEKTTITPREKILIFGPGPIGLLLSQVIKAQNAYVILAGITKDEPRLELAKSIGIDQIVNTQKENLEQIVLTLTEGVGVDKVFDCSGAIPAVNQGLSLIKKKGQCIQVGIFGEKFNKMDQESIIQRELSYIGSRSQKPSSWPIALNLLEEKKIATKRMITKIVPLENWREGFEAVMSGHEIKVIIQS